MTSTRRPRGAGVGDLRGDRGELVLAADEPQLAARLARLRGHPGEVLGDRERARALARDRRTSIAVDQRVEIVGHLRVELRRVRDHDVLLEARDSTWSVPPNGGEPVHSSYARTPSP